VKKIAVIGAALCGLVLTMSAQAQPAVPKVVIKNEEGGQVDAHWTRFRQYRIDNADVEVLGGCHSACTLIVGAIEREKLCFGPNAKLGFHAVRDASGTRSLDGTKRMFEKYPAQIQHWLNAQGGVNEMTVEKYWFLSASELWAMGYRKCDASAGTSESEEEKTLLVQRTYKRCLKERDNDAWKRTFTQEETTNFCGCWSVLINDRMSQQEFNKATADGTWAQHPVPREVTKYCREKYGNLPDVTAIRKKKW
jgi:hypothetical protein